MLLGLDLGTSSVKAILVALDGRVIGSASAPLVVDTPRPGWTEQSPATWWRAARDATTRLLHESRVDPAAIRAIGLSGQMHGCVLVDRHTLGRAGSAPIDSLRPVILWNDQRTITQCTEIEAALAGRAALVAEVGNAAIPGFTLPKLLWIRQHEPDLFRRAAMMLLPKDMLRLAMTGRAATDVGDASGTLLLNVAQRQWSARTAAALDINPAILPPLLESCEIAGELTPWAAEQLSLLPGIPVIAGSGDNQTAAAGAGVVTPGRALAILGTSGVIYAHAPTPKSDSTGDTPGRVHSLCAGTGRRTSGATADAHWCNTGCMLSAAASLSWAASVIAPNVDIDHLLAEAEAVPAGSAGLLFLPYLSGERCPHTDPTARGAWIGLTARHTRAHLIRAVIEGVSITLAHILDLIRGLAGPISDLHVTGGGSRSALWRQTLANATAASVIMPKSHEGSALGAALMAGVGIGHWPTIAAACRDAVVPDITHTPDADGRIVLAIARGAFDPLYAALRHANATLSSLETRTKSPSEHA